VHPATEQEISFRHSGWKTKRNTILEFMKRHCFNDFYVNRFEECGSTCSIEYSPSEKRHRLRASYCHCRHCEPCMRAKANKLAANLRAKIGDNKKRQYRFITLTLRHTNTPLQDQIKRLYLGFRKLRNRKAWKRSQKGGAAMLEVKWDAKARAWHPHLHVVSEGTFLDKKELSNEWLAATGDSFIVDIRQLHDAKEAAYYVGKYVTKGTNGEVWSEDDVAMEWCVASKGVRTCTTYGTWRGYKLLASPTDPGDWVKVASLTATMHAAQRGERWAVDTLCHVSPEKQREEVRRRYLSEADDC